MRKYGNYPVVANYNLHTQLRSRPEEVRLHDAKKYADERSRFVKSTTTSDSTIENNLWKKEIDQFESTIYNCLQKIESNPVGRMVLGLINKQTTVWIVPKSDADMKKCNCAQTGPLNYDLQLDGSYARGAGSGDTVIQFRPELGDDTLLHELVHAYRYSYKKFNPMRINVHKGERLRATQSTEELFAHVMENIYLSQSHRPLMMDYMWAWNVEKSEIYDFLLENTEMIMALKFFMRHEYMAMLAAHTFGTEYNPFRDQADLEKQLGGVPLPELGNN